MSRWIFFPPFFSFFILIATVALHRKEAAFDIHSIVWGLVVASYVCLCGVSAVYIAKRDRRYNVGVSLLAQGLLLSAIAVQAGVVVFAWIGLVLFFVGLLYVFIYATRAYMSAPETTKVIAAPDDGVGGNRLLSKLGVPICYTDSSGFVEGATTNFLEAIEREPEEIIGESITDVISIDEKEVALPSGKWWLDVVKSGHRHYFYLHPTQDGKPLKELPQAQKKTGDIALIDTETGLYTSEYRKIRGPEEVSRAQRYKRPLSGMLLELTFETSPNVNLSDEQFDMLRKAFAVKVRDILRVTDCGFWMDDHNRIQLLLPETPQAGAKTLMSRLLLLPQDVFDEDIRAAVNPKVRAGMYFYNGASKLEYGVFTATLEQAYANAKGGAPGVGNAA